MEELFEDILLDVRYDWILLLVYAVSKPEILMETGFTQTQVKFLHDLNEKKNTKTKAYYW